MTTNARGFTLMEVLIGLTVAALALTAGFATLGFMTDTDEPVDVASALALRGATTRNLLTEWLGEARYRQGRRGQAFEGLGFGRLRQSHRCDHLSHDCQHSSGCGNHRGSPVHR